MSTLRKYDRASFTLDGITVTGTVRSTGATTRITHCDDGNIAGYTVLTSRVRRAPRRTDEAILADIRVCLTNLEPENISWDGERLPDEVDKATRVLNRQLKALRAELGREA